MGDGFGCGVVFWMTYFGNSTIVEDCCCDDLTFGPTLLCIFCLGPANFVNGAEHHYTTVCDLEQNGSIIEKVQSRLPKYQPHRVKKTKIETWLIVLTEKFSAF